MRLQIGLELFNFTPYIVIVSFLTNEENKKYIFHNNQFNKLEILFFSKRSWSSSPKVCGSDKIKNITKVTLFSKYASKISLRNLNRVMIFILLEILIRQ